MAAKKLDAKIQNAGLLAALQANADNLSFAEKFTDFLANEAQTLDTEAQKIADIKARTDGSRTPKLNWKIWAVLGFVAYLLFKK